MIKLFNDGLVLCLAIITTLIALPFFILGFIGGLIHAALQFGYSNFQSYRSWISGYL